MDAILVHPDFVEACALLQYFGGCLPNMPTHPWLAEIILAEPIHPDLLEMYSKLLKVQKPKVFNTIKRLNSIKQIDLDNQQLSELQRSIDMRCFGVPLKLKLTLFALNFRIFEELAAKDRLPASGTHQLTRRNASRLGCDRAGTAHWFILDEMLHLHVYAVDAEETPQTPVRPAWRLVASSLDELCALIRRYADQVEQSAETASASKRSPLRALPVNTRQRNRVAVADEPMKRELRKRKLDNETPPKKSASHRKRIAKKPLPSTLANADDDDDDCIVRPELAAIPPFNQPCGRCSSRHTQLQCAACSLAWHTRCVRPPPAIRPLAGWLCPLCAERCLLARLHELRACLEHMPTIPLRQRREAIVLLPSCDDDSELITSNEITAILSAAAALPPAPRIQPGTNGGQPLVTGMQPLPRIHHTSIYFDDRIVWQAHIRAVRRTAVERVEQLEQLRPAPGAGRLFQLYVEHVRIVLEQDVHIWEGGCTADDYAAFDAVQARAQRVISGALTVATKALPLLEPLANRRRRHTLDEYQRLMADVDACAEEDMPESGLEDLREFQQLRGFNVYKYRKWDGCFLQRASELLRALSDDGDK